MKARYYSPRLERDLIPVLFRERCKRKLPMTKLASSLIRAALRYEGVMDNEAATRVAESSAQPRRGS
jgi:hypothetical protein